MIGILLNKHFVDQAISGLDMRNYIEEYFKGEIFSDIKIERTPLGLRIVISTSRPGRIIGPGGRKINELSDRIKDKFKIKNPQVDVKSIKNPDMDASIVARQIALALESGNNHKKIGNLFLKRIMDAGALGVEIIIAGKLGGSKGLRGKFSRGYIKHCGDTSKKLVDFGFAEALSRPGKIGIQVKIMKYFMDTFGNVMTKADIEKEEETRENSKKEDNKTKNTEEKSGSENKDKKSDDKEKEDDKSKENPKKEVKAKKEAKNDDESSENKEEKKEK